MPVPRNTLVRLIVIAVISPACLASVSGARTVHCGQIDQQYLYYSPDAKAPLPVIMLLHGAGDRAENMVDAWKRFATKQGIALLAPELPRDPKFEEATPKIFRCEVEGAKQLMQIDPLRIYLFGNSMGGYLAYDGAMFQSQYLAAIAIRGGGCQASQTN